MLEGVFIEECPTPLIGRTPKGLYSPRGLSRHLLETSFSEPFWETDFYPVQVLGTTRLSL